MCAVPPVPPDQPHQGAQATARFGRECGVSQAIGLCRAAEHFVCFRASGNGAVMTGVGCEPAISRHPGEGRDSERHALPDEVLGGLRRGDGEGGFRDHVSLPLMTETGWKAATPSPRARHGVPLLTVSSSNHAIAAVSYDAMEKRRGAQRRCPFGGAVLSRPENDDVKNDRHSR